MDTTTLSNDDCHIRDDNFEAFSLVWFISQAKNNQKNREAQKRLRTITNQLKIFDDRYECLNYIHKISNRDRIVFLVNCSRSARKLISHIHQFRQVSSIYIYCKHTKKHNKQWRKKYSKVRTVSCRLRKLVSQIKSHGKGRILVDEPLVINIFHADSDKGQSTTDLNGQFVFSQLLIDVLLRIEPNSTDSSQLISFCERVYAGNPTGLSNIQQFKDNYTSERALFWFTRDLFFYRMLNQALRRQNVDILFLFRSYIQDIYKNLKTNQCQSSIKVYRGQWMSNDELKNLRQAVGQFISFNSFLSTSKQRQLAQIYTDKSSDELQGVLFEIDADPGVTSIKPFADISSYSNFNEECEVLFMLGSIFHIVDICFDDEQIWLVRMKLCGDDKHDSKSIIEYIQNQYEKDETHLGSLGIILANMGRLNEAEKYYTCLLNELSSNDHLLIGLYCNLGLLADRKGEYDTSLKWYRKSLKLAMRRYPFDSLNIVNMHNCIGLIYQEKGYFNRALKTYRTAVSTFKRAQIKNYPYLASVYSNIGIVYQLKEKPSKALSFFKKSLSLRKQYLPRNHPDIGGSYNNIGGMYYILTKLDLALKYFNRSLEIRLKSLPSQHEDVAFSYANIGLVYEDKNDRKQALAYFQRATDIIRNILPSDHPDAIRIENDFRRVSSFNNFHN